MLILPKRNRPKQGVCQGECIEPQTDDYATVAERTIVLSVFYGVGPERDRSQCEGEGTRQGRKQGVSEASPALRTETTMFSSVAFCTLMPFLSLSDYK